jgi:hypothetical protein
VIRFVNSSSGEPLLYSFSREQDVTSMALLNRHEGNEICRRGNLSDLSLL